MGATKHRVPKRFLGAFKHGHRKGVREYVDEEFAFSLLRKAEAGDKEALKALEWLTKYNNETYRGVVKKNDRKAHHKTKKLYKEVNDSHNARRRDLICNLKSGKLGSPDYTLLSIEDNPAAFEKAVNEQQATIDMEEVILSLVLDIENDE